MDDWVMIILIVGAVLFALALGLLMGADWGYKRGWLFGERQARTRTLRQIRFSEEIVRRALARERKPIGAPSE